MFKIYAMQCSGQVSRISHVWRRDGEYKGQGVMKGRYDTGEA